MIPVPEAVRQLAQLVGVDPESWRHQCHRASLELVNSGQFPGGCVARGWCLGVPGQHSWIALGDPYDPEVGIVDPTLWSYDEAVKDVWHGSAAEGRHLPHGQGNIWTTPMISPGTGPTLPLTPAAPLTLGAQTFLDALGPLDAVGWMRLANAPVSGWPAAEVIEAMDDTPHLKVLVPIDRLGMLTDRNPGGLYLATS